MLKNYLKIAWRNIVRKKFISATTIFGLSVGILIVLLMLIYVTDQLSYDRFHNSYDQIYRIASVSESDGKEYFDTGLFAPLGPLLNENITGVQESVRFYHQPEALVNYEEFTFLEENNLYTEPSFFDVFSFSMEHGDPVSALEKPFSIVITPKIASKYFGDQNPLGLVLILEGRDYTVTGVVESPPKNSSIQYNYLLSLSTLYETQKRSIQEYQGGWANMSFITYLKLNERVNASEIQKQVLPLIKTQTDIAFAVDRKYQLEPFKYVYLRSDADNQLGPSSDIKYLYIFSIAALLVVVISCFNYMNIVTAQYVERTKEVGIRKSSGASRRSIIFQFLGESTFICLLALIIALLFLEISLPFFNYLINATLQADIIYSFNKFSVTVILIILSTGVLSGLYPAVFLSDFEVSNVFRHSVENNGGIRLRKWLISLQFALSAGVLICTLLMQQQLKFTTSKNLGLESEQVMVIQDKADLSHQQSETYRDLLSQHSGIFSASISGGMPTKGTMGMPIKPEGHEGSQPLARIFGIDSAFLETLGLKMKEGRFFHDNIKQDSKKYLLVNEATVREFGWEEPIGKSISIMGQEPREIIGVVNDFHFESVHNKIVPVLLIPYQDTFTNYISLKFKPESIAQVISHAQSNWESMDLGYPFEYFFLDKSFEELYAAETRMSKIFNTVTVLTILIACLGLFGLVTFMVKRRTKEIGIRKVLGANISNLLILIGKDYITMVLIGFMLSVPVTWYLMNQWLNNFFYRIEIGFGIYLASGIAITLLAMMIVTLQASRAALSNPVKSLRSE